MALCAKARQFSVGTGSLLLLLYAFFECSSLFAQTKTATTDQRSLVRVPFVGCNSDGQSGPVDAPKGEDQTVDIPIEDAQLLAYFRASEDGFGVLAPRGWYCFNTYGSNGATLYVSPNPISATELFTQKWRGFAGQVIQLSMMNGSTSGRFDVARVIARVFPAHMDFAKSVISEGIEPASNFPQGPYPNDKLVYRNKQVVEFLTPANREGLGTESRLQKNGDPISGVAILFGEETNLVLLSVRLPPGLRNLAPAIITQTEHEAKQSNPK